MSVNIASYRSIYFIGIGGIGMSALARYFASRGFKVGGYDKTPSPLTHELEAEGLDVHYEDLGSQFPEPFNDTKTTLVIYTPAIPAEMGELVHALANFTTIKRSEALGLLTQTSKGLGVAGTHGKTTTSTMLAHVLHESSLKCSAFLGGISSNFNSNVLVDSSSDLTVVEADEFDRSFLRLSPFASIITAMDPDHLDIYGTEEAFREGFQAYADKHLETGLVIYKFGLPFTTTNWPHVTYGIEEQSAQVSGWKLRPEKGVFKMDVRFEAELWEGVELGLPGIHNAENALAVIAMCRFLGCTEQEIRTGLATFKGVKRRFERCAENADQVYIDDYAHHPTEIKALIDSIRLLYPNHKVAGVFQPHLFTRTRDFLPGFIEQLARLDEPVIMPIYPARELPIPGVTSDVIVDGIGAAAKLLSPEEVLSWVKTTDATVILTIGAGDIDRLVPIITQTIKSK